MYIIDRGPAAWLCVSAIEAYDSHAVQLRLRSEDMEFSVFERKLDAYERVYAGVITVYRCSDADKCEDCKAFVGCEILKKAQETAQAHSEFAGWVEAKGGYIL